MKRLYWDTVKVDGQKIYFTFDGHGINFVSDPGQGVSQVLDFYTNAKFEFVRRSKITGEFTKAIKSYLKGKNKQLDMPIDFLDYGSDTDRLVWDAIAQIPYGNQVAVQALADENGLSQDDVERAINESPVWLFLPMQRVIARSNKYQYRSSKAIRAYLIDVEQHPKKERKSLIKDRK